MLECSSASRSFPSWSSITSTTPSIQRLYSNFGNIALDIMASLAPALRRRAPKIALHATRTSYRSLSTSQGLLRQGPGTGSNMEQANDPQDRKLTPNVSKTNETPVDSFGASDAPLQESTKDAERQRTLQAPNRATTWSRSQMPRDLGMTGPRFEQTIMEKQVGSFLDG
jgi:hypothetical protein